MEISTRLKLAVLGSSALIMIMAIFAVYGAMFWPEKKYSIFNIEGTQPPSQTFNIIERKIQ